MKVLVIAFFAAFALAGCIAVPVGPPPPRVVPGPVFFERYPNGYYITPEGHYPGFAISPHPPLPPPLATPAQ